MRPRVDFVVHTTPDETLDFQTVQQPVRTLFRAARKVAFETGDREATAKICHFLIWFLRAKLADVQNRWDLNYTVDQMEKEFAFPDLRLAMKELEELRSADDFRRP